MSEGEVLEEIRDIIGDRRMKATGKLDAISDLLEEAGFAPEEDEEGDVDEEDDEDEE